MVVNDFLGSGCKQLCWIWAISRAVQIHTISEIKAPVALLCPTYTNKWSLKKGKLNNSKIHSVSITDWLVFTARFQSHKSLTYVYVSDQWNFIDQTKMERFTNIWQLAVTRTNRRQAHPVQIISVSPSKISIVLTMYWNLPVWSI